MRVYQPDELGKDGYPAEWHATIKHTVREQAGNRCVRCQHPYTKGDGEWSPCTTACRHPGPLAYKIDDDLTEGDWPSVEACFFDAICARTSREQRLSVVARWRILTVHHLDGNKANCCWWNLAALCQRCHLQIQGRVVMARVWPWEHSEWFRPYVAGYYASVYLGEDLTRDQVEARLEELLALERAA